MLKNINKITVENYMDTNSYDHEIIETGDVLKDLPVPTKVIESDIYISEAMKKYSLSWINEHTVEIDKPIFSDNDIGKIRNATYSFEECIKSNFSIYYLKNKNPLEKISYNQLKGISSYCFLDIGFLFIKDERIYILLAEDKTFYQLGRVNVPVLRMKAEDSSEVSVLAVTDYKMIEYNSYYERMGGDFTGYIDKFEVSLEKRTLSKEKIFQKIKGIREKKKLKSDQNINMNGSLISSPANPIFDLPKWVSDICSQLEGEDLDRFTSFWFALEETSKNNINKLFVGYKRK